MIVGLLCSVNLVSQCLEFSLVFVMEEFYSDRSTSSTDLVMDTNPPGPQLGGGAVTCAAPVGPCSGTTGASTASASVSAGIFSTAGMSGPLPAAPSTFGYVPPYGGFNVPRNPYVPGPGQLYAHGSPGLAAAYMSPPFGVGTLPFTSRPRMSLAPDLMFPQPAIQPYGNVQDMLARRAHLDHALAAMVSFLFLLLLYNTLGVEITHCIALWPTQFRCCDYLYCGCA